MPKEMHEHYLFLKNILLAISGGSWVGWMWLKTISEFCALILPITGVVSFLLFLVINFTKIGQGFREMFKKDSGSRTPKGTSQDPGLKNKK